MIVNFGILSFFKKKKLSFRKKITVSVWAVVYRDGLRNRVVFDRKHNLTTLMTLWFMLKDYFIFGEDRVYVSGSFCGYKVYEVSFKEMGATT